MTMKWAATALMIAATIFIGSCGGGGYGGTSQHAGASHEQLGFDALGLGHLVLRAGHLSRQHGGSNMKSKIAFSAGLAAGVLGTLERERSSAGQVTGLITFTAGTAAKAADVNANFTAVKTAVDDNAAKLAKFGTDLYKPLTLAAEQTCTLGEILLFAGTVANGTPAQGSSFRLPKSGALCAPGDQLRRDGQTTFALPDLRSVAPNGPHLRICDVGFPRQQ